MRLSAFDYKLPASAIAQPPARRDRSKLLVLDRATGRIEHANVRDLPVFLKRGDCLVVNDTKVFRARLRATVSAKGGSASGGESKPIELFLIRPDGDAWIALAKPGRRCRIGMTVASGRLRGVVRARMDDGTVRVAFTESDNRVIAYANRVGEVPAPPYITRSVRRLADYQTTYARYVGSVAAPTAGFHLTPRLLRAIRARGVRIARVTLHIGLGTFQPIRTNHIEDHVMHAEWADIPAATVRAIEETKANGGRVVAVGTTTLRTLEGGVIQKISAEKNCVISRRRSWSGVALQSYTGWINLYITPGFHFRVVDALLTNFHLPKSSLLVLVSAFAASGNRTLRGRDMIIRAYQGALRRGYRFYSFGDAMLIQ